ncbi:MAG TPA: hypothetical protein VKN14_13715 [Flavobacteriaceae bacterium]|nr:hypothetical protein [Flavobacteriaceae bacterium]
MDWRIKALLQKVLSYTRIGDRLNHLPATLSKKHNENVVNYQLHECLRKFSLVELNLSKNCNALEIGTGYSLISPIVLHLLGFNSIVTVDISKDVRFKVLKKQLNYLKREEFLDKISLVSKFKKSEILNKLDQISRQRSLDDILETCNIKYLTSYTLESIEKERSIFQYICSQVVFEHIRPNFLEELNKKTRLWLGEKGYSVHTVNFIDHFANPGFFQDKSISEFNFLKHSDKNWNFWAGNSIAYTNRLSYLYYLNLFERNSLEVLEFIGENYRVKKELDIGRIHNDVKSKYNFEIDLEDLIKFQRGTFVLKG